MHSSRQDLHTAATEKKAHHRTQCTSTAKQLQASQTIIQNIPKTAFGFLTIPFVSTASTHRCHQTTTAGSFQMLFRQTMLAKTT